MMSVDLLSDCCNTGTFNDDSTSLIIDNNAETEMVTVAPPTSDNSPSMNTMPAAQQLPAATTAGAAPIYQMNFDVEHIGKKKPQSKRQATWTYGFPKQKTENTTTTGGMVLEEHQARLTWSTHSGKYIIEVDGVVVFESCAKGSVLEHKFIYNHAKGCVGHDSTEDGYIKMRIVACRKPPLRSSTNFRCYEFVIGSTVFRDLPRMNTTATSSNNHQHYGGEEFHNEDHYSTDDVGVLSSILDIVDPSWRSVGMA